MKCSSLLKAPVLSLECKGLCAVTMEAGLLFNSMKTTGPLTDPCKDYRAHDSSVQWPDMQWESPQVQNKDYKLSIVGMSPFLEGRAQRN